MSGPVTEQPMPYHDYLGLAAELRAEYVDGAARMSPPPSYAHQKICQRLTRLLEDAAGARLDVVGGVGWELVPRSRVRIPDVMVLAGPPTGSVVSETPLVVVEVLSGNRSDDLVRKSTEYLEAGVAHYWIVDPRDRVLEVFANRGGWQSVLRLDEDRPSGTVELHTGVRVDLDLALIFSGPAR